MQNIFYCQSLFIGDFDMGGAKICYEKQALIGIGKRVVLLRIAEEVEILIYKKVRNIIFL